MTRRVAIIGAGFTGLAAARDLQRAGFAVTVYVGDAHVGGLGGSFTPAGGGEALDRFYHHWFTSDRAIMDLITELGLREQVTFHDSLNGVYTNGTTLRLSTPMDLLRYPGLPFLDRLRLAALGVRARLTRDWRPLESLTAQEWLTRLGGPRVYAHLFEPLLRGKFGAHADTLSAVWIWNKLKLRGGSRGRGGAEHLGYVRGSFATVAQALADDITAQGGTLRLGHAVQRLSPAPGGGWVLSGEWGRHETDLVIATPAPALVDRLIGDWADAPTRAALTRVPYLANLCLVLELDRSLAQTYWLNVTDPSFPFVGVIEHTRFQSSAQYQGRHIVYLSRYLPQDEALLTLEDDAVLAFALPHLKRMFPAFDPAWIRAHHVWRAMWAQPVVERHYSSLIPPEQPAPGLYLCSMAQIYPEDRGTNYAVRAGRALAAKVINGTDQG